MSIAFSEAKPKVSVKLVRSKCADSLHQDPTCIGLRELLKTCCNMRFAAHYDANAPIFDWLEHESISERDV